MRPVLAIDLGGTSIKAAVVAGGHVLAADAMPARSSEGLAPQLPRLAEMVAGLCRESGTALTQCAGLGMAVPFLVDPIHHRITSAPREKYFDACGIDLVAWSQQTLGLPLRMENDAHAACLGEWRHGAGVGVDDLVMFTLGTGIGCSVVLRGKPLRGKRFQAGVLCGHFICDPDGPPCDCCPARGCFESLAASRSLPTHVRNHPGLAGSSLAGLVHLDFKILFDHAAAGDAVATAVRDKLMRYWSALAVNVCAAYDPDRIVIGGAVAADADVILPAISDYVNHHAWSLQTPEIVAAALGNHAGVIGIASLFTHDTDRI